MTTAITTTLTRTNATSAPRRARTFIAWAVQLVLASQFVASGLFKLTGDPRMVAMFAEIGAGQWLRVVVGALEVAGAVGLLVPRLTRLAAAGLVALMLGATVTNVAVLDTSPALPLVFLLLAAIVAALRHSAR